MRLPANRVILRYVSGPLAVPTVGSKFCMTDERFPVPRAIREVPRAVFGYAVRMSGKRRATKCSAKSERKAERTLHSQRSADGAKPYKVNGESRPSSTISSPVGCKPAASRRGRPRKSGNRQIVGGATFGCKREATVPSAPLSTASLLLAEDANLDLRSLEGATQLLNADDQAALRSLKDAVSNAALEGKQVKEIVGMVKDDDGRLFTVIRYADDSASLVANSILNKAYPQLVIKFYEAHLKWE